MCIQEFLWTTLNKKSYTLTQWTESGLHSHCIILYNSINTESNAYTHKSRGTARIRQFIQKPFQRLSVSQRNDGYLCACEWDGKRYVVERCISAFNSQLNIDREKVHVACSVLRMYVCKTWKREKKLSWCACDTVNEREPIYQNRMYARPRTPLLRTWMGYIVCCWFERDTIHPK